jgi:hypothetical protein
MAMSTVARAQEQAQPDELRHSPSSDPPSRDASTTATLLCHGFGGVEGKATIALDIPPMTRDASRFEVALDQAGISNLVLDATVVVT